jgi:hypothetical protein
MTTDDERLLREAEASVNVDGGLVWVALDVDLQHRRALLITRDIIAERPYHKKYVPITWRGCSLRRWLNTVFYLSLPIEISRAQLK